MSKLFKEASITSVDGQDYRFFSIATKNAYQSEKLDLNMLNFFAIDILNIAAKSVELSKVGLNDEKLSLYRNYFETKSTAANSIENAYYSLSGLVLFKNEVFVESDPSNKVLAASGDGGKTFMRFSAKNYLGTPFIVNKVESASYKGSK